MKKLYVVFVLAVSFMITNCGSTKDAVVVDPYLGSWSLLIEGTPQGTVSATMTLTKTGEGNYAGSVISDVGAFDLNNVTITDQKLSSGFTIDQMGFNLIGTFQNTAFQGYVSGMGEDFPANGKKIE